MKEYSQWVTELPHVQYSRVLLFTVVLITAIFVYFGKKPMGIFTDLTLPNEIVSGLEIEDQQN